jgi:hypothetical protein
LDPKIAEENNKNKTINNSNKVFVISVKKIRPKKDIKIKLYFLSLKFKKYSKEVIMIIDPIILIEPDEGSFFI